MTDRRCSRHRQHSASANSESSYSGSADESSYSGSSDESSEESTRIIPDPPMSWYPPGSLPSTSSSTGSTHDTTAGHSSRGPTLMHGSDWNPSGGILHIVPNELNQVVDGYTPLASRLGVLARDGNLMPLTYRTWSHVPKENKERIWREVKINTDADESMKKFVLASVGKKWREWKARVKQLGYTPFDNDADRLTHRPERVHEHQWRSLVYYWGTRKAQKKSIKNKEIRKKKTLNHITGRKPFSVVRVEETNKKNGVPATRLEVWMAGYTKDNKPPLSLSRCRRLLGFHTSSSQSDRIGRFVDFRVYSFDASIMKNTPAKSAAAKKTPPAKPASAKKTPPAKSAAAKKTPPSRKSTVKTPPNPPPEPETESSTPKTTDTKAASASKAKLAKTEDTTPIYAADSVPEQPVEQEKASADAVEVTPETKVATRVKKTRTVVRKVLVRTKTPTSAKAVARQTPKAEGTEKLKGKESSEKEQVGDAKDVDYEKKEESSVSNVEESAKKEEPAVENVEETKTEEDQSVINVEEPTKEEEKAVDVEQPLVPNVGKSTTQEDPVAVDVAESLESREPGIARAEVEVKEKKEEMRIVEDKMGPNNELVSMEEDTNKELKGQDAEPGDAHQGEERMEECRDQEVLEEFGEEELAEENIEEHGEEEEALEEECMEFTAVAKERKIRKEVEIFVGGLDRDAVEEDVKKAFENIGEVVEVRLNKDPSTNKNKGYAFVKFATKEQASRALSEMKNPLIRGKRCGTAPNEDNDTLFLGNICNTWTKEAIKQKLKDYGIEGVENITLVSDVRHEGLSRGFAFIEFSCHADAMLAYKRLQKPDAVFGHSERTAKVAFAEPLREPDPEVMAQVKSVFVDGLPPQWDEDRVREQFKGYGEIVRIMLARNLPTAKRKDYGFVDFTTHEAAVACVEGINNRDFGDGNLKTKVKARLSNPLPKSQAIKGGMCGGFRIGHGGAGSFSRFGRGFGRGGHAFNRPNFQHGRGFYQRGRGHTWRMGFNREHDLDIQYPPFQRREMFGRGGWRDSFGGAHEASSGGSVSARPNLDRVRHDAPDRGRGRHIPPRRQPFPPEEGFNRPFVGRHFDDPYFYDDSAHGMKRPFFMTDQDRDYMEPSRLRPRLDYSDPAVPFRTPRYQDSYGAGSSLYSHDYYGSDYSEGPYSSFYGSGRPYGGGYYY